MQARWRDAHVAVAVVVHDHVQRRTITSTSTMR